MRASWLISLICLITAHSPLVAAEAQKDDAPWYQFEMIIFERISAEAGNTEFWPLDPGTPSNMNARHLSVVPGKEQNGSAEPVAFTSLPRSEWQLLDHEQRLKRSRNYRPHVHVAWRQQMTSPAEAQRLFIKLPQRSDSQIMQHPPPKLEGTIKIGVKRYLHLEIDLLLHRLKMAAQDGSHQGQNDFGPYYQPYRLQANRRMRSGDLYYIDHPVIGVLFLASRYQLPEPTESVPLEAGPIEIKIDDTAAQPVSDSQTPVNDQ